MSKTILAQLNGFTPVIDSMVDRYGLVRASVFGRVWRYCQMSDGVCRAKIETIGDGLGLDEMTIRRHIHALAVDGYLDDLTPGLKNKPHTYRDTGKAGMRVTVDALSESEGAPSQRVSPALSESPLKIVVKKETKDTNHAAGAATGISTVEMAEMEPIILEVPQGGNKSNRAAFMGTCPECHCKAITQDMDTCPGKNCGIPVKWVGSKIADDRYKTAAHSKQDAKAKQAAENAERLSETTAIVLALARATAPSRSLCSYAAGEENSLLQYEQAYGAGLIKSKLDEFKAAGDKGRGLILHLIRYLAQHHEEKARPKAGALPTREELANDPIFGVSKPEEFASQDDGHE